MQSTASSLEDLHRIFGIFRQARWQTPPLVLRISQDDMACTAHAVGTTLDVLLIEGLIGLSRQDQEVAASPQNMHGECAVRSDVNIYSIFWAVCDSNAGPTG